MIQDQTDQTGQGLVEYAIILVLIAIVVIVALTVIGSDIIVMLSKVGGSI